jgi:cytoskeletal protein CcmA (bactofilin family)
MFNKKKNPAAIDTILGEMTTVNGNLDTEGSLKILGKVNGDIHATGDIYVEGSSQIKGSIFGQNIFISGNIKGNAYAKGILHLQATARMYGDVEVFGMVTDEGALLQGNCKMIDNGTRQLETAPAAAGSANGNSNKNKLPLKKSREEV